MREVLRPDSLSQDYASGTAGVTAAPNAQDAVVEGLKSKLRAADLRERELHQHLLFHMKEKELLVDQVAELQRVCEALLLSQMQEAAGPSTAAATAAATAALSAAEQVAHKITARQNDGGARSSEAPPHRQQHNAISSSLKAIMETVSPTPAHASFAALSRSQEHPTPAPTTAGTLTPGALSTALGVPGGTPNVPVGTVGIDGGGFEQHTSPRPPPPAAVQTRTAGSDPSIDIPQLLLERGGRIRITSLWEAYRSRFGDTPYTLKDLFSMVKTGAIPFVVHEPPAGIRLLEEAPVYQELRHQLQLQRQLGQQRQAAAAAAAAAEAEAAAQAASGSSYHAQQGAGSASPMMDATDARGAGAGGLNAQQQQQQQQHQRQDAFPPPPKPIASTPPPGPYAGHRTNPGAAAATATNAAGANFTSGSAGDWTPPVSSRSPAPSNGGNAAADHHDNRGPSAEAEASGAGRAGDEKGEEQEAGGEGEHGGTESQFRFGSYGSGSGSASDGDGAATNDAGAGGTAIEPPESTRKRRVDWKELQRNLNLLLKDEGALNGRDLNHVFQLKFGKSPYLDGTPLRYAVSAGWLNGVCFDVTNNTFNLSVRVPVDRREDAPQGAPAYPPGVQRRASTAARSSTVARSGTVAHRTGPTPLTPGELDWKQLSREFRQLLSMGALEAKEVHAKYHREYSKPLHIGAGYSMRQAVIDGRLEGITFERGSRRLALV